MTAVLPSHAVTIGQMPPLERTADGRAIVRGLRLLRPGDFTDSQGRPFSVNANDLAEIATNFANLRAQNVLPNVPMRIDHSWSQRDVIGYFENVWSDGSFLYGDFIITDPTAVTAYAAGTFRNRSAEIAPSYTTNGGQTFKNVMLGCAFVDLPAVEGLFGHPRTESRVIPLLEENPVAPTDAHTFTINGVPTQDLAAVERHIAAQAQELVTLRARTPEPYTFRIAGADVTDPAVVQQTIVALEAFRDDATKQGRVAAVKALVAAHKLSAAQEQSTIDFVQTLSSEGFNQWQTTYEKAPVIAQFGQHAGDGNGNHDGRDGGGTPDPLANELAIFEMQRATGMFDAEQLRNSSQYKALAAAGRAPTV